MSAGSRVTVAITGASGAVYGIRLVEQLLQSGSHVNLLITSPGFIVINEEVGIDWRGSADKVNDKIRVYFGAGNELIYYDNTDFFSPLASGSAGRDTLIIAPCSMGTLGRIASGISSNLLERAADVVLKERGNLIILPRETPLNSIHLKNMLALSRAGAVIVPAMPAFYHKPETMDDLVDFVVGKVLDQASIVHNLFKRWGI